MSPAASCEIARPLTMWRVFRVKLIVGAVLLTPLR